MSEKLKSVGECLFCGKMFSKAGINRHLQKHIEDKMKQGGPGSSFLLKVETNHKWGSGPYFLSLWIDGETDMEDLDCFLRAIWLECCGHMSAFTNPKLRRQRGGMWDFFDAEELLSASKNEDYEELMENTQGEVPMSRKGKAVFKKGLKLEYEYDFGSTTSLQVMVVSEYPVKADKKIVLLSRNEPLAIECVSCGKPATQICTVCEYEEEANFCEKCSKKHSKTCEDFEDYAAMPLVNSPRMGVCGYDGGRIDLQRDGIFQSNRK